MRFGWTANLTSARLFGAAKGTALLFVAAYATIYWLEPFSDLWNTILTDSFLVVSSGAAAFVATLIWKRYDRSDAPRRIWVYFAIGLWLWTVAELLWGYLNVTQGEVPVGMPDLLWISGYVFFAHALFVQYQILVHPTSRELPRLLFMVALILLGLDLVVYGISTIGIGAPVSLSTAVNSFYPAADLLLALVSFWLGRHFIGGAFARPWFGLLAFAFADLLYAWIEMSGLYAWSVNQSNILSAISDIAYLVAYLILALGIFSQWTFLKYGLRSPATPR